MPMNRCVISAISSVSGSYRGRPRRSRLSRLESCRSYWERVTFSPIDSGATKPFPHSCWPEMFAHPREYLYAARRRLRGWRYAIAELAVDHSLQDFRDLVISASIANSDGRDRTVWSPPNGAS